MLGFYENFPHNIHKTARFTTAISNKRLQQTITQVFYEMNGKAFKMEDITVPSIPKCTVNFEFGIAEAEAFNYLDQEETDKVLRAINKKPFQIMDFFCATRYYKEQNVKKTPLRFDYYMIRFIFNKKIMETQIFHERGPRHITPEDIANLIVNKVNGASSRKILKSLKPA